MSSTVVAVNYRLAPECDDSLQVEKMAAHSNILAASLNEASRKGVVVIILTNVRYDEDDSGARTVTCKQPR